MFKNFSIIIFRLIYNFKVQQFLKLFQAGDSSLRLKVLSCNEIEIQNDNVRFIDYSI